MFNAVLADPKLLKSSIDAISNMIDEAGVSVSDAGLRLRAMDPAHVALVDFELKKEAFDKFEVKGSLVLGLDLDRLNTILKRTGTSDKISLALDEEANSLRIKFENTSTRTFNLPLIEVSEEELKVPNLDFPCIIELSPRIISEAIKDAEIISDHVTLRADEEYLYVAAKGDLGNVEVTVAKEEAVQFETKQECRSMFSIEYLKDMVKASDIANSVRLSLGDNIPVKMDFLAPNARLSFLLAPRIESD